MVPPVIGNRIPRGTRALALPTKPQPTTRIVPGEGFVNFAKGEWIGQSGPTRAQLTASKFLNKRLVFIPSNHVQDEIIPVLEPFV